MWFLIFYRIHNFLYSYKYHTKGHLCRESLRKLERCLALPFLLFLAPCSSHSFILLPVFCILPPHHSGSECLCERAAVECSALKLYTGCGEQSWALFMLLQEHPSFLIVHFQYFNMCSDCVVIAFTMALSYLSPTLRFPSSQLSPLLPLLLPPLLPLLPGPIPPWSLLVLFR